MDMMDILKKYVDVIHPKRFGPAIATEAKRDDAKLTFLHVLLISLLGVLALVAYVSIYTRMIDDMFSGTGAAIPPEIPTLKENMLQSIAPVALILNFLGSVVSFYAINGFLFLLCRALGGNGKLGNQLYVISVIMVAVSVPYALLMLLAAFAGRELVLAAYEAAVRERYRFYSYGDCMLVL